jgi:hypothetical protein
MKTLLGLVLAVVGGWLLLRRRSEAEHVVVAWGDGSELELEPRSPERERLVAVAREALR